MRVVQLSAEYPPAPGGVGDYTRRLGAALSAAQLAVSVWTIRAGRLVALDPAQVGDPRPVLDLGPAGWGWRCWGAVASALQAQRPDVLHIQYQTGAYGMHPAINLLPWRLRRMPARPRLVVTAHDLLVPYLFPKAGALRGWANRRLLEDCDRAVVTNTADLAALSSVSRALPGRASLIPIGSNIEPASPPGYDRAGWRARLGVGPEDVLVAYFGLISPTKGLDLLLDALARLPASFHVLVVGGEATAEHDRAYAAALRARLEDPALSGRVSITGYCPEHEVSGHLLAADMAALPFADGASFRRGSLLAALAHGLPVVTTVPPEQPAVPQPRGAALAGATLPELIDGVNTRMIQPGDAEGLVSALRQLAGDQALRKQLGAAGQQVAAEFGWEAIAMRHVDLYQRLIVMA